MDRICPYCGEFVPSNSITCPKCYRKMPAPSESERTGEISEGRRRSRPAAVLLDAIPGLFGFLGLGQLYMGDRRAILLTLFGLVVFVASVFFTVLLITIPLAVPMWFVYIVLYIGSLAHLVFFVDPGRRSR